MYHKYAELARENLIIEEEEWMHLYCWQRKLQHQQVLACSFAAIAMFLVALVGLLENIAIFWLVTRMPGPSLRLLLFTAPIMLVGILAVVFVTAFGK